MTLHIENADDFGGGWSELADLDAHTLLVAVEDHANRRRLWADQDERDRHQRIIRALYVALGYRADPEVAG